MNKSKPQPPRLNRVKTSRALRVGFLPENDCAPLVVAHEFGLFKKYGLEVELENQASWKHVHDKVVQRQLDASHAPGMLPFLTQLGLAPETAECVTGLVLNLQGNAITISRELWRLGVRDGPTMREQMWADRAKKAYTFGITCPLASQYALLCQWLKSQAPPHTPVRLESVPAEQLFPLLKLGYLDGFCAGEPWTSVAVQSGVGACVATSAQLAPWHPEKILLVRKDFAEQRSEEHERLIAALLEACFLCEQTENRELLCGLLAQPRYVNAPRECLEPDLLGPSGRDESQRYPSNGLNIFYRGHANEPSRAKAAWLSGRLFGFLRWRKRPASLDRVFRPEIFGRAKVLLSQNLREHFQSQPALKPETAALCDAVNS